MHRSPERGFLIATGQSPRAESRSPSRAGWRLHWCMSTGGQQQGLLPLSDPVPRVGDQAWPGPCSACWGDHVGWGWRWVCRAQGPGSGRLSGDVLGTGPAKSKLRVGTLHGAGMKAAQRPRIWRIPCVWAHTCVPACVFMYVGACMCMHARQMYMCMCVHACMHMCMYVHIGVWLHACMCINAHVCLYVYACTCVRACAISGQDPGQASPSMLS